MNSLALPAPYVDPVDRVGQRLAVVPGGIGHDGVDGDGPQIVVVELERPRARQRALRQRRLDDALTVGAELGALAGDPPLLLRLGLGLQPRALGGHQPAVFCLFRCSQVRDGLAAVERGRCRRRDSRPLGRVLDQRGDHHRGALEHQALGRAHRHVDDAALEELARSADHDPAEPGQPRALVQRLQHPRRVALILQQDVVVPAA